MVRIALLLGLALAHVSPLLAADKPKTKRPAMELRTSPRFGFSPLRVLFTLELKGGDDIEDYYCPEIEWEWDDGGKSVEESDCPPFEPGVTTIERRRTASHEYGLAGTYRIEVTLRKADRVIAKQSVSLTVRPGLGDPSF
jgi:hypothetical protein